MTAAEVRENLVACDLGDSGLQRIIDGIEAEIEYRYGDNVSVSETFFPRRLSNVVYPSRRVDSVTEVVEELQWSDWGGFDQTTLAADDYRLTNKIRIDRLPTGTNPRSQWGDRVTVTYVPEDDSKRREMVIIDLVKLELAWQGVNRESMGDYSMSQDEYDKQREDILARLGGRKWA